ncbi:MAG: G-D-S-L family lipolytic protein [Bacteroidetes bacterium]|nr:G-D-S-L family lipolytic protein [Bacteroidota bacterium]
MKRYAALAICGVMIVTLASFTPAGRTRVIFFGDSITYFGAQPGGYIPLMHTMLEANGRGSEYDLVGAGIGGNKIYDLLFRVDSDVIAKKPDIVYVFIGVNDVWAKSTVHTGTDADRFDRFYDALVKKLQKAGIKVVVCTPLAIGEKKDHKNPQDPELDVYAQLAREVAYRNHATLCDLRALYVTYIQANNPDNSRTGILTTDGVHLNDAGNKFVAQEMLKVLPQ